MIKSARIQQACNANSNVGPYSSGGFYRRSQHSEIIWSHVVLASSCANRFDCLDARPVSHGVAWPRDEDVRVVADRAGATSRHSRAAFDTATSVKPGTHGVDGILAARRNRMSIASRRLSWPASACEPSRQSAAARTGIWVELCFEHFSPVVSVNVGASAAYGA
jgi:hypothetical protein